MGRVVRFEGRGTIGTYEVLQKLGTSKNPRYVKNEVSQSSIGIGSDFYLTRTEYDFKTKSYVFMISADTAYTRWGLCKKGTCSANITSETYRTKGTKYIGKIDGKKVEVATTFSEKSYYNYSALKIRVPMEEDLAKKYVESMPLSVTMYLKLKGINYHRRCRHGIDYGFGVHYKSELVRYVIKMAGNPIAEYGPI
jgi:hypothetical protein